MKTLQNSKDFATTLKEITKGRKAYIAAVQTAIEQAVLKSAIDGKADYANQVIARVRTQDVNHVKEFLLAFGPNLRRVTEKDGDQSKVFAIVKGPKTGEDIAATALESLPVWDSWDKPKNETEKPKTYDFLGSLEKLFRNVETKSVPVDQSAQAFAFQTLIGMIRAGKCLTDILADATVESERRESLENATSGKFQETETETVGAVKKVVAKRAKAAAKTARKAAAKTAVEPAAVAA